MLSSMLGKTKRPTIFEGVVGRRDLCALFIVLWRGDRPTRGSTQLASTNHCRRVSQIEHVTEATGWVPKLSSKPES